MSIFFKRKKKKSMCSEPRPKLDEKSERSRNSSEIQKQPEDRMSSSVKFFNEEKGYGFLATSGDDLFLHISDITDGSIPVEDAVYWYEVGENKKDGRPVAKNASLSYTPILKNEQDVDDGPDLFKWAYIPLFTQDKTSKPIVELSKLALDEDWRFREIFDKTVDEYGVLVRYIRFTFHRLSYEGKIVEGEKFAVFNTGLVDRSYNQIYALFEKNHREMQPWRWRSFCVPGQGYDGKLLRRTFNSLPDAARYFSDIDDIFFDPDAPFDIDEKHIVLDGIKGDRYPHDFLKEFAGGFSHDEYSADPERYLEKISDKLDNDDEMFRKLLNRLGDAIDRACRRARWNYRAVVPQYYPRRNVMSFLLPLSLLKEEKIDAALVVQSHRTDGDLSYQGYTIFPLSYAYSNARLVAKPISDWLDPKEIFADIL